MVCNTVNPLNQLQIRVSCHYSLIAWVQLFCEANIFSSQIRNTENNNEMCLKEGVYSPSVPFPYCQYPWTLFKEETHVSVNIQKYTRQKRFNVSEPGNETISQ